MDKKIKMGNLAKDVITGFKGTVGGFCQYLTGCNQILLAAPVKEDGSLGESHWFDDSRVVFVEQGIDVDALLAGTLVKQDEVSGGGPQENMPPVK